MLTDEQIMLRVGSGEIHLMSEIFRRYNVLIFNFYLKSTSDRALSSDLTQNLFEKLIKYKSSFKPDYTFKSWIYRIATNIEHDHFRKEKSHKNRNEKYFDTTETQIDPNLCLEKKENNSLLHLAIQRLPQDQRDVIWMTRFEKMKYADVALALNVTESAIKVKVHRAIKRLRTEYLQLEKS